MPFFRNLISVNLSVIAYCSVRFSVKYSIGITLQNARITKGSKQSDYYIR